jgi:aquaporin Z
MMREPTFAAKLATEFIGTFFLVLTIVFVVSSESDLAPLGIGAVLIGMVYAGGHISGAHYNPAVSIAAFVRGRIDAPNLGGYIVAQLVAGLVAALLGLYFFENAAGGAYQNNEVVKVFVVEALFTFALGWVMLNVATSRNQEDNHFYGIAIGFLVAGGVVAVGGISGAVFNPAVALGIGIAKLTAWSNFWIYLVSQVAAGVAAGLAFRAINPDDV